MNTNTNDRLLRIDEVAKLLACSWSHVRRLRSLGKLPACRTGTNSVRWKESSLQAYIRSLRND